jgi:phage shock protein B
MDDNLTVVLIVLISVLGPIWIVFHYRSKASRGAQLSAGEAAMVENLGQTAMRLEQRVAALERVLDTEAPGWRGEFGNGGQYGRQAG